MTLQIKVFKNDAGASPVKQLAVVGNWNLAELQRQCYAVAYGAQTDGVQDIRLFTEGGVELTDLEYLAMVPDLKLIVAVNEEFKPIGGDKPPEKSGGLFNIFRKRSESKSKLDKPASNANFFKRSSQNLLPLSPSASSYPSRKSIDGSMLSNPLISPPTSPYPNTANTSPSRHNILQGPFTLSELTAFTQEQQNQFLQSIVDSDEYNGICFDCLNPKPEWASVNHGAFICIRCSGIHRHLGVHLTFVQSVGLDKWKPDNLMILQLGGNRRARKFFEDSAATWKAYNQNEARTKYTGSIAEAYRKKISSDLALCREMDKAALQQFIEGSAPAIDVTRPAPSPPVMPIVKPTTQVPPPPVTPRQGTIGRFALPPNLEFDPSKLPLPPPPPPPSSNLALPELPKSPSNLNQYLHST